MTDPSTPQSSLSPDEQDKLRELTAQSWNMELAISGVAMFAILLLPDLLDQAFDYLRYNFMTHTEGMLGMLPSLAYSMIKATSYVLFMAFLVNFVMRAYWVGLVGLLAVYPSGIHYDRLPFMSDYARKRLETQYGPLERYIVRLDRRCNIVFALAFQFVFLFVIAALAYVAVVVVYLIVRPLLSDSVWQVVKTVFYVLSAVYFVSSIVLIQKPIREHPVGMKVHYRFMSISRLTWWGLYKPSSFISNTFYSHIPQKSVTRTIMIVMLSFLGLFFIEFLSDTLRTRRISLFNQRHLYSARVDSLFVDTGAYDNQRDPAVYVDVAAIQADVIREPYIRLFVAYPKALDTLLTKVAKEPVWSDTLSRREQRNQAAIWKSSQINRVLQITINDSLYKQPNLLFAQPGEHQQPGFQTVLVPTNLHMGKNTLRIQVAGAGLKEPEELTAIPFWYVPEK